MKLSFTTCLMLFVLFVEAQHLEFGVGVVQSRISMSTSDVNGISIFQIEDQEIQRAWFELNYQSKPIISKHISMNTSLKYLTLGGSGLLYTESGVTFLPVTNEFKIFNVALGPNYALKINEFLNFDVYVNQFFDVVLSRPNFFDTQFFSDYRRDAVLTGLSFGTRISCKLPSNFILGFNLGYKYYYRSFFKVENFPNINESLEYTFKDVIQANVFIGYNLKNQKRNLLEN